MNKCCQSLVTLRASQLSRFPFNSFDFSGRHRVGLLCPSSSLAFAVRIAFSNSRLAGLRDRRRATRCTIAAPVELHADKSILCQIAKTHESSGLSRQDQWSCSAHGSEELASFNAKSFPTYLPSYCLRPDRRIARFVLVVVTSSGLCPSLSGRVCQVECLASLRFAVEECSIASRPRSA